MKRKSFFGTGHKLQSVAGGGGGGGGGGGRSEMGKSLLRIVA